VRLADGRRVKLEAIKVGGRLVTSRQALVRFLTAQPAEAVEPAPAPRTPGQRERAAEAAEELKRLGA
jgi:hypothetical protein